MKDKNLHIIQKTGANVCRFLLAASFIFSGFVKAVDPLGFQYKIQDYLTAFGVISWFPSFFPLLGGIILSAIEFSIGIFLFFGIKKTISTTLALVLMIFMTPLTLYLAIFDPVSDCGCFGDAVKLTPWETFAKNLVLLPLSVVVWWRYRRDRIFAFSKAEVGCTVLFFSLAMGLGIYCYAHLPLIDFRPFKVGVNIYEAMNAYSADPGPQAGKTVSNRFRLSSRYTSTPSFTAKGQTPPTAWPMRVSASSWESIFALVWN